MQLYHNRAHGVITQTLLEGTNLFADNLFGNVSFLFTEVFIGINNAFQIVNVINGYAGNIGKSWIDVTRNGNINQNQRPAVGAWGAEIPNFLR